MINVLITGDFCPNYRIQTLIEKNEYKKIFNDFLTVINKADLAITNLECPLTEKGERIEKTGPNLKASSKTAAVLKLAGFKLVTLANNHIMDYGETGLDNTLECCRKSDIDYVGSGFNLKEARKPYFTEINGQCIAIVNFCENEWSTSHGDNPGANPLNLVTNYYDIEAAKAIANYVIVIVHGGHEGYQYPSPRMKESYRFFIDAGADAVIGHHGHCFSGYEIYKESPIFYSLGNFCFDWKGKVNSIWNRGFAVQLILDKPKIRFELVPYKQGDETPGVCLLNKDEEALFNEHIRKINVIIASDEILEEEFSNFCRIRENGYLNFFEPLTGKLFDGLRSRKLLPSFITKNKRKYFLNLIRCEAHRDIVIKILDKF